MTGRRYFAVGTRPPRPVDALAAQLSDTIALLTSRRHPDGTWGGPDTLDRLICTTHVAMTLMATGIQPTSELVKPALDYLAKLDTSRVTTFFWRSGPLLNVDGYQHIVSHDVSYLARLRERAGGNPNYPAPFFLLKLLRFSDDPANQDGLDKLLPWIIAEWTEEKCWYGSSSITSMGLALLADLQDAPQGILDRSMLFLEASFGTRLGGRLGFSDNIVDDAFTIYNLYERFDVLGSRVPEGLFVKLDQCLEGILALQEGGLWRSAPPFGGSVDSPDYATAVVARAAIARALSHNKEFEIDLALGLADAHLRARPSLGPSAASLVPFWGGLELRTDPFCFVAMPFEGRRTEIYEEYVKNPIERLLGIECRRVDEITRSSHIMRDVWGLLTSCSVVIADLSGQNANVFYELGLAHVLGKPFVLIAEKIDDVPFDLRSVRTITYGNSPKSWQALATRVVEYVSSELNGRKL